ncbi:MAG: hypothetical protein L0215_06095 [Gemmataceae bacterium]|nr:hypothetical protein [Gemmataceae bacterium]
MNTLVWHVALASALTTGDVELAEPVAKIWDQGAHNAFTDLLHWQDRWLCVFREGTGHAAGAGTIRVLTSVDGKKWTSAALIESKGVDLRDPHVCVTPDGRLLLCGGAALPPTRDPVTDHYSFVAFSKNPSDWTAPARVCDSWQWLWRVTWHKRRAYGVAYQWNPKEKGKYTASLYQSKDAVKFDKVTDFKVPQTTEATLRFDDDVMLCLQRRDGDPKTALLGRSKAPYEQWDWKDLGSYYGGPNFIQAPDGRWWACGRMIDKGKPQTVVCALEVKAGKLTPALTLPSGGDNSYAGLVWHDNLLWISYYSSHEGKAAIYLAKVRVD